MLNDMVRIPMPGKMAQAEKLLRKLGQGKVADQFILSMNQAAEKAAPKTTKILGDAIHDMSIKEAAAILRGPDNAATQYFDKKTRAALAQEIKPVVSQAMGEARVIHYYKLMMDKASASVPFLKKFTPDLDQHVTNKALDGLFVVMAIEEKKIRQDPVARSTDLLKKVFGQFEKVLGR